MYQTASTSAHVSIDHTFGIHNGTPRPALAAKPGAAGRLAGQHDHSQFEHSKSVADHGLTKQPRSLDGAIERQQAAVRQLEAKVADASAELIAQTRPAAAQGDKVGLNPPDPSKLGPKGGIDIDSLFDNLKNVEEETRKHKEEQLIKAGMDPAQAKVQATLMALQTREQLVGQVLNMITNMLRMDHENKMAIIRNIRA